MTVPPITGSLLALVTVTPSGFANGELTMVDCGVVPSVSVSVKPCDWNAPMSLRPVRAMPR